MYSILTIAEFADKKNIGKKYDNDKVEASITKAHTDLREALGAPFYFDVMKNQSLEGYTDLIDGGEFIKDEMVMYHDGLKEMVADFAYARYLYEVNANPSPFGMVGKTSQDSQPVDRNMIKDLVTQANQDAGRKWELVEDYLDTQKEQFPIWEKSQKTVDNNPASFASARFSFFSTGKNT